MSEFKVHIDHHAVTRERVTTTHTLLRDARAHVLEFADGHDYITTARPWQAKTRTYGMQTGTFTDDGNIVGTWAITHRSFKKRGEA